MQSCSFLQKHGKQKGKRKRRELQGEGQPVRYCAIDQTHPIPIQAWELIQPPCLQRCPRTEGREVEVTPLEERKERQREREGERTFKTHNSAFLTFFSQHEIMCLIHVITCRCADVIESQENLHIKRLDGMSFSTSLLWFSRHILLQDVWQKHTH